MSTSSKEQHFMYTQKMHIPIKLPQQQVCDIKNCMKCTILDQRCYLTHKSCNFVVLNYDHNPNTEQEEVPEQSSKGRILYFLQRIRHHGEEEVGSGLGLTVGLVGRITMEVLGLNDLLEMLKAAGT